MLTLLSFISIGESEMNEKKATESVTKIPLDDVQNSLYQASEKIYPRKVSGLFARLKLLSGFILLGLFYVLPWVNLNSQQIVLFDLPARKFYIFGMVFWPQDAIYLAFLLILAGLSLFFFTTLAGRLWCGFACPQTVWTDMFLWMERVVEGDRPQRMKLDKAPWTFRKVRIKVTKQFLWISVALFTGFTFVGFFTPIRELSQSIMSFSLSPWETFWLLFYGFATYGNAGWMREQVCIYMCPYARFQSAMFDKNTLIVAYDKNRGEPRGARKKSVDYKAEGLGECINCTLCVQVCPTGIDIRNGLQYQCVSCSACIDVCNEVMDKMDYPRGLIRYTTENTLENKPTHIFRPRILLYGVVLLIITLSVAYSISQRSPINLDILRDRNSLFRETRGMIENVYILKLMNMDNKKHDYEISAAGIEGMKLRIDASSLQAKSGEILDIPVSLRVSPSQLKERSTEISFTVKSTDGSNLEITQEARFLGPIRR